MIRAFVHWESTTPNKNRTFVDANCHVILLGPDVPEGAREERLTISLPVADAQAPDATLAVVVESRIKRRGFTFDLADTVMCRY